MYRLTDIGRDIWIDRHTDGHTLGIIEQLCYLKKVYRQIHLNRQSSKLTIHRKSFIRDCQTFTEKCLIKKNHLFRSLILIYYFHYLVLRRSVQGTIENNLGPVPFRRSKDSRSQSLQTTNSLIARPDCLEVLTVDGTEMRLFGTKAFPLLILLSLRILHSSSRYNFDLYWTICAMDAGFCTGQFLF